MILTVTLNAAIDRTVAVPSFRQGNRHRAVEATTAAGGKGVNVARALKLLGRPVIATGLAGGPTGARLMERLAEESILTDFTWIGESRGRTSPSSTRPPESRPRSTSGGRM
jgi:1-phosphofructokinase/tagatose 6-phosphate kinase